MTFERRRTDVVDQTIGVGRASISDLQLIVLTLVAEGHGNKAIADRIGKSENDVKAIISRLLTSLHAANRAGLAQIAVRLDVVGASELAEHEIHALLRRAPVLIALLRGPDHRYVFVNDAYRRRVGDFDYIGHSVAELFPSRPDIVARLDQVYASGETKRVQGPARIPALEGETTVKADISFIEAPVRDNEGTITGVAFYGLDLDGAQPPDG